MSGQWMSTGGSGRVWVPDGLQMFKVTYHAFIVAPSAGDAVGIAQEGWSHPGDGWTATPVPIPPPPTADQPTLPEAMIDRVHGRVHSDPAGPESAQVTPDKPAG